MILVLWLALAILVVLSYRASSATAAERIGQRPALAGIAWDVWFGLGVALVGMLWGESARSTHPPEGDALVAWAIFLGLVVAVADGMQRVPPTESTGMRVGLPIWVAIGLFPVVALPGRLDPLSPAARSVATWLAVVLVIVPAALWLDRRFGVRRALNVRGG